MNFLANPIVAPGTQPLPGLQIYPEAHQIQASLTVQLVSHLPCNAGDLGSIPGLGRSPGAGHGNPLQYSCLENPVDRGAWQATVHGVTRVGQDLVTKPPPPRIKFKCLTGMGLRFPQLLCPLIIQLQATLLGRFCIQMLPDGLVLPWLSTGLTY